MKSGPVSQSALKKIVAAARQIKNKDNQLGVQNQIKSAELAANANQRSVPEGKVDIGRTWKRAE